MFVVVCYYEIHRTDIQFHYEVTKFRGIGQDTVNKIKFISGHVMSPMQWNAFCYGKSLVAVFFCFFCRSMVMQQSRQLNKHILRKDKFIASQLG